MKNIWHIFTRDLKGLIRNPLALIIAIGLCIIPSLYAWFNIYSNWDPYANTANIKIAVATEDKDYTLDDGTTVNMGNEVVEQLKENDSIGWVVVEDTDEALEGLYRGDYYATVVISEDFTYSMYNVFREEAGSPTITYYENEKRNAVATKITDTAVSTLKQSINEQFIEVVASTIFTKTNELSSEVEQKDVMTAFEERLTELNDNLKSYSAMIGTLNRANEALGTQIADADAEISKMQNKVSQGVNGFSSAKETFNTTQASLGEFSQNIQYTMDGICNAIDAVTVDISALQLGANAQNVANGLNQTVSDTAVLMEQLDELRKILVDASIGDTLPESVKQQLQKVLESIESMIQNTVDVQGIIGQIQNGALGDAATSMVGMMDASIAQLTQTLNKCSKAVADMKNIYVNNLVPQLNQMLLDMDQTLANAVNLMNGLNDALGNTGVVFEGLGTTVDGMTSSMGQIKQVLDDMSGTLTKLLTKLEEVDDDEKVQALIQFLQGDPGRYGEFFADPVRVKTEEIYPIKNYGSAMTPFYTTLALWVGGTILVALIKVKAEAKDGTAIKPHQLYFGRYLLFFVMGQVQAAIIVLGNIYLLHCQIQHPVLFWVACALASFTFTLFIYSMALAFGDVGKAAAVVVMVIQIAGSGGTFPIELLPQIYQNIHIFFPFPYAIDAMRETIGGMYGSNYVRNLAELMLFAGAALVIGLIVRIPFMGIIHFMEKRMEDTELM